MPPHLVQSISAFYGMVRDREGTQLDKGEFHTLLNVRNWYTEYIKKRDGSIQWFNESHDHGADAVIGLFTYINSSGIRTYVKMLSDGTLWKHADGSGTWTQITINAPTFVNTDTFFAQLSTSTTGGSPIDSGTQSTSDSISVTDSSKTFTVNNFVNDILLASDGENKLISANTETLIYVKERFDQIPIGNYSVQPRQIEFFIANGTNFYKCDGTTLTRLDNTTFAGFPFNGLIAFGQRLFGWIDNRLHYSDAGVGEQFSRNAWRDFKTNIKMAKDLQGTLFIYEENHITAQDGDSPDNYAWTDFLDIGTTAPKSVANYLHFQFFLNRQYGVCMISTEKVLAFARIEPLSISRNFLGNDILNHSSSEIDSACAYVFLGKYYIFLGRDCYVLHIEESLKSGLDPEGNIRWVWTKYKYPNRINGNCMHIFDTDLVVGSQTSGQVYQIEYNPIPVINDTFAENDFTELSLHSPDVGGSWSKLLGTPNTMSETDLYVQNGEMFSIDADPNQGSLYTVSGTYPTADYSLSIDYIYETDVVVGQNCVFVMAFRIQDANNMYAIRWGKTQNVELWKKVTGSWSMLYASIPADDKATMTVDLSGTDISVIALYGGTPQTFTVSDSSISLAGTAGLGMGAVISANDDMNDGIILENFSVILRNFSDDGDDIAMTIEKRDWMITDQENDKTFHSLKISQAPTSRSVEMDYSFPPSDSNNYSNGVDVAVHLETIKDFLQTIVIPGNIHMSDGTTMGYQNKGSRLSFIITESGSNGGSPIQKMKVLYDNDLLP